MTFGSPGLLWLLLLAPVAALVSALLWRLRLRADAAWASRGLWDRLLPAYRPGRLIGSVVLLGLAVLGATFALARPRWGGDAEHVERRGVDVVFVLDSSLSMAAADVAPSRLFVAKAMIRRMAEAMPGDRVALVQTEGEGMMLSPLTLDGAVLDLLLDTVDPGSLPRPGTELASGLDAALKLFGPDRHKHRALVVISDGEDFGGGLDGLATRLREAGVSVFALGVGALDGVTIPLPDGSAKRDEQGTVVITRLREDTLEELARRTGGEYLRVTSAATDPEPILNALGKLEKRTIESEMVSTSEERFQWPLALAIAALALHLAIGTFASRRREEPA
jgi:Ca-activated chloride channel family protein